jgi:NDP-sugar pyrophosphorylase family protein
MIPALVLSAGFATRLRPLSLVRAKAALPVAGQPLIRRILTELRDADVTDAVVNLHHLPHTIAGAIGDGTDLGLRVRYSWEHPILGSAGGPRLALPLLGGATFLIANGDTLTDADIPTLVAAHRRSGALVTLAVTVNPDPQKYGGLVAGSDGAVTGFTTSGSGEKSWHFIGLQVVQSKAFASLPIGTPCESVSSLYPSLIAAQPGSVRVHVSTAEFLDIGAPDDYFRTSMLLARREGGVTLRGLRARIDPTARIDESILWDDVDVGARATLRRCVVTDGTRVPSDTSWSGVSLRTAVGELAPGERQVGALAVAAL